MEAVTHQPVHVVHLIGSLDVGGAETVALDLCRAIPDSEVHQVFVCLSGREGRLAGSFRRTGADVVALSFRRPLFALRIRRILRQSSTDSVVSHVSLASGVLLGLARLCGVRVRVARFHSQADGRRDRLGRRAFRSVMRGLVALNATHVLGVTESSLEFGLGRLGSLRHGWPRAAILPNGVDTARFTPAGRAVPTSPLVVVHVGRASPEKNRGMLAKILECLRHGGPSDLHVIGSDDVHDLGPGAGELTLVGPTDDVPTQLRLAHVLVLPSLWEGLPTVILEALSCDVAVVASDLPGIREIARHTEGVTVIPHDAPAAEWASAIRLAARTTGTGLIRRRLLDSPYTLEGTATRWREVWAGARRHARGTSRHPGPVR